MKTLICIFLILATTNLQAQRPKYAVGDTIKPCGIVFYVQDSGSIQRILICALNDLQPARMRWYNGQYITTGANKDGLFSRQNAEKVIAVQGKDSMYAAIAARSTLQPGCFDTTGWYLPSVAELNLMYTNLAVKRKIKFAKEGYWSSVEQLPGTEVAQKRLRKAWIVDFLNGRKILNDKANKYHVRAVKEIFN